MSRFASQIATADRLIKKNGRTFTIYRKTGALDAVAGTFASGETSGTISAVTLPASKGTIEAFDDATNADLVPTNVRFFLASAKGFAPRDNDEVLLDGARWRIAGVTTLAPNGEAIIYKFGAAKL